VNSKSSLPSVAQLSAIRLLVLDVDGVLTDGRIHLDAQGREQKVFHVHDGHGIKQAMQAGIQIAVISGRQSQAVEHRMAELGIEHFALGQVNKSAAFSEITAALNIPLNATACMGDDIPDLVIMANAGLKITVADAQSAVIEKADWVTEKGGGLGAVREVCDALIAARTGGAA